MSCFSEDDPSSSRGSRAGSRRGGVSDASPSWGLCAPGIPLHPTMSRATKRESRIAFMPPIQAPPWARVKGWGFEQDEG